MKAEGALALSDSTLANLREGASVVCMLPRMGAVSTRVTEGSRSWSSR